MKKTRRELEDAQQKKWFRREIEEGVRDAYLSRCPACRGAVFGALDHPKCRDCGWDNQTFNYPNRGAA